MKRFIVIGCTFLTGCAVLSQPYTPMPIKIFDANQFAADEKICLPAGANYKPTLSLPDIGYGALSGGAQSATGGVIGGPLVPAIGAAGGATSALATGLDAFGKAGNDVARHCLYDFTLIDHSAVIARPED